MSIDFKSTKDCMLISLSEGRPETIITLSQSYVLKPENNLFQHIVEELNLTEQHSKVIFRSLEGAQDTEYNRNKLNQLKKDITNARVEMIITLNHITDLD